MYILEGNIGTGKSTFLRMVGNKVAGVSVVPEPTEKWDQQKDKQQSLLANFYKDPKRWAYTMEGFTVACRIHKHIQQKITATGFKIFERSIYSGHYCFAKNSYKSGFMDNVEWEIYEQWFEFLVIPRNIKPKGFIYLKASPEVAFKRMQKRRRGSENVIPMSYIKQIHERHQEFLVLKENIIPALRDVPVLVLECDDEFEANPEVFKKHAEKLSQFLLETS